jgi:Na+/serine symporter
LVFLQNVPARSNDKLYIGTKAKASYNPEMISLLSGIYTPLLILMFIFDNVKEDNHDDDDDVGTICLLFLIISFVLTFNSLLFHLLFCIFLTTITTRFLGTTIKDLGGLLRALMSNKAKFQ